MGTLSLTAMVANTLATDTAINAWSTALLAVINGGIDATNLANLAVTAAKHADQSASTDTKHSGTSIKLSDAGAYFTTDNAEAAIQALALFTGYKATATGYAEFFFNKASDNTTTWGNGSTDVPTCSVVVPANVAPDGVKVVIGGRLANAGGAVSEVHIPLTVNGTALSTSGTPLLQYELAHGSGAGTVQIASREIFYLTADGYDGTIENTFTIDDPYHAGAGTTAYASNYTLAVYGLKARS